MSTDKLPLLQKGIPMTAALYIRVSTLNQIERESLKNQEERLVAYCKASNIAEHKVYKDAGVSAKDIKRPALEELMQDIKQKKISLVIVTKLDRITRSLKDLIELMEFFEENKIKFISITQSIDTTGPMGRFMLNLLGSVAQVEREMTAERVGEDMLHRALAGKWNGGPVPYGYTIKRRIIRELKEKGLPEHEAIEQANKTALEARRLYIDEKEAETVKQIFDFYLQERSLRGVTNRLNTEGIKTRENFPWATSSILRVLSNPTYTGKIWYGKRKTNLSGKLEPVSKQEWKIVQGEHERIIPDDTFYRVQELIKERSFKNTRAKETYLLSGLVKCGKCQGPMYGYTYRRKYKSKTTGEEKTENYFWYKCHNYASKGSSVCTGLTLPGKELEGFVIKNMSELSKNKNFLNDKKELLDTLNKKGKPEDSTEQELKNLVSEEKNLLERQKVLLDKLECQVIDDLVFKKEFERLKGLLDQNYTIQDKLKARSKNFEFNKIALNNAFEQLANFNKNLEFLDIEGKKARLGAIISKVIAGEGKVVDVEMFFDVPEVVEMLARVPSTGLGGFRLVEDVSRTVAPAGTWATPKRPAGAERLRLPSTAVNSPVPFLTGLTCTLKSRRYPSATFPTTVRPERPPRPSAPASATQEKFSPPAILLPPLILPPPLQKAGSLSPAG
ncbi:MAG: recombinase family protein [Candidatus Omnitrophota bacterium]